MIYARMESEYSMATRGLFSTNYVRPWLTLVADFKILTDVGLKESMSYVATKALKQVETEKRLEGRIQVE